MTKSLIVALRITALAWLATTAAHAAILEAIEGEVMVNRGNGYKFVSGTVELNPGDMIIVNGGGAAQLSYGDACNVPVQAGSVVTVVQQSPCAAQGNTGGTPGVTPGTLAFGAVVVGGGIGAAVLMSNNNDKPVSP